METRSSSKSQQWYQKSMNDNARKHEWWQLCSVIISGPSKQTALIPKQATKRVSGSKTVPNVSQRQVNSMCLKPHYCMAPQSSCSWELGRFLLLASEQLEDFVSCWRACQYCGFYGFVLFFSFFSSSFFFKASGLQLEAVYERNCGHDGYDPQCKVQLSAIVWCLFHKALVLNFHWSFRQAGSEELVWPIIMDASFELLEQSKKKCVYVCLDVHLHACVLLLSCSYFIVKQPCLIM